MPEDMGAAVETTADLLATVGRRGIQRGTAPKGLVPDIVVPSGMESVQASGTASQPLELIRYHEGLDLDIELTGTTLGTFLHRCFEILGANSNHAENISGVTGVELTDGTAVSIAASVNSFEQWVAGHFSVTAVHRELPLLGLDDNGSVVSGTADLVLETGSGIWILDHKSDQIEDPEAAFNSYWPQLECYARLLQSMGHIVLGVGINWIRRGEAVLRYR